MLAPFLIAGLLAYLGNPLVNRLTSLKLSRTLAALIVFSGLLLVVIALILFLIPLLTRQFEIMLVRLPLWVTWAQQYVLPWLNQHLGISATFDLNDLKTAITQHWQQAGNVAAVIGKLLQPQGSPFSIG